MEIRMIVIAVLVLLAAAAALRARYELHTLKRVCYQVVSEKIAPGDGLKAVFLTDLHGRSYGKDNAELVRRIKEENPDLILSAGDMVTSSERSDFAAVVSLFKKLVQIAPVYASFGNHEKRMSLRTDGQHDVFQAYVEELQEAGVIWLNNKGVLLNGSVALYGLDIDFCYYKKLKRQFYSPDRMKQDLASVSGECFNIILAHNPRFFKTYTDSAADLILAGHYHGGAVRIGRKIGVISPQFRLFPRYSRGRYQRKDTVMIVSSGCGSHKVNLRLFNKPEIVVINIHGDIV